MKIPKSAESERREQIIEDFYKAARRYSSELHDVIVRVSAIEETSEMPYLWYELNEIKWEGKLQDWYQACADIVKDVTTGGVD